MDRKSLARKHHEQLTRLRDSLREELIACRFAEQENENAPEILNVFLDGLGSDREGILGEFFFFPSGNDDETVQLFSSVLTLADDIPDETLPALIEAISYINYRIPCGSFAIDSRHDYLIYKLTVPIPASVGNEALFQQVNACMGNAVAAADNYLDLILDVRDGTATIEDVVIFLGDYE